jgi:hypothetical protein
MLPQDRDALVEGQLIELFQRQRIGRYWLAGRDPDAVGLSSCQDGHKGRNAESP